VQDGGTIVATSAVTSQFVELPLVVGFSTTAGVGLSSGLLAFSLWTLGPLFSNCIYWSGQPMKDSVAEPMRE
jgi:hypothetical protein